MTRIDPAPGRRMPGWRRALPALALVALTLAVYVPAAVGGIHLGRRRLRHGQPLAAGLERPAERSGSSPGPPTSTTRWSSPASGSSSSCGASTPSATTWSTSCCTPPRPCWRGASSGGWGCRGRGSRRRCSPCTRCWWSRWRGSRSERTSCRGCSTWRRRWPTFAFSPPDGDAPEWRRWRPYALASALFVAALLSKTVTATLPAALLLAAVVAARPAAWTRPPGPAAVDRRRGGAGRAHGRARAGRGRGLRPGVGLHPGGKDPHRRTRPLVLPRQAGVAGRADLHLSALAHRRRGLEAVALSRPGRPRGGGPLPGAPPHRSGPGDRGGSSSPGRWRPPWASSASTRCSSPSSPTTSSTWPASAPSRRSCTWFILVVPARRVVLVCRVVLVRRPGNTR